MAKGTVVAFSDVPCVNYIRSQLPTILGGKAKNLVAEGNCYYDASKCGVAFHGDSERCMVVALRPDWQRRHGGGPRLVQDWFRELNSSGRGWGGCLGPRIETASGLGCDVFGGESDAVSRVHQ